MSIETVSSPRTGIALLAALIVALGALTLAAFASPAQADTLRVTNTNDSGTGSLRAAIYNAHQIGDTITFAPRVQGTITLTSGGLFIDKNLTIKGPGARKLAVSGNNSRTVFSINAGKTVRISGLTITEGSTSLSGGGIYNQGNLTLTKSVVSDNYAGPAGGGIRNENVLTLTESVVSGNVTNSEGGGIKNSGTLTVQRSTISGNTAGDAGGGIYSLTYDSEKTTISNSTISGNSISSANGAGGGVRNTYGLTEIQNSTITNNKAPDRKGGGVASDGYSESDTIVVSSNISGNVGDAVVFFGSGNPFVSNNYNLVGYGNAAGAFNKTEDRRYVGDTGIGALANNGGFTRTHALQSDSPAINTGSPNCPPPATDQRGAKRPYGGRCDIGSFEFGATPPRR